jgi:hypothetical protein
LIGECRVRTEAWDERRIKVARCIETEQVVETEQEVEGRKWWIGESGSRGEKVVET